MLQLGALYVVGKTIGAPPAENTAVTEHEFPLPQIFGIEYGIGLVNGAIITALPPHEFVIVNVPVAGGAGTMTVPVKVYCPAAHGPGIAVRILQFVAPAPACPVFV